jgi:hypothetical protein
VVGGWEMETTGSNSCGLTSDILFMKKSTKFGEKNAFLGGEEPPAYTAAVSTIR